MYEEIALEISRVERECLERVRSKIAAQQLGEAWVDLAHVERGPDDAAPTPFLGEARMDRLVDLPVASKPTRG